MPLITTTESLQPIYLCVNWEQDMMLINENSTSNSNTFTLHVP